MGPSSRTDTSDRTFGTRNVVVLAFLLSSVTFSLVFNSYYIYGVLPYVHELSSQPNPPIDERIMAAVTNQHYAEIIAKETTPRGMPMDSLTQPDSLSTIAKAIEKVEDLPKVKRLLLEEDIRRPLDVAGDSESESSSAKQGRDEKATPPGSQPKAEPLAVSSQSDPKPLQLDEDAPKEPPRNPHPEERCAINLYGLPRAFQSLVLPALIQNVIRPNAAHNCDYFVHFFNLTQEVNGRSGGGGHLDPSEILLLEQHVQREAPPGQRRPTVVFLAEQEADFWKNYDSLIQKTRNTHDSNGKYLYFPWKDKTYKYPTTVDNIIKMWSSIQSAWLLMERHATEHNVNYTRVAMLRSDVMYATPIDIYRLDNYGLDNSTSNGTSTGALFDHENRYAVVPAFARFPVNDRLFYGPHAAVKIWAAERFARLETHVQSMLKNEPGYGMHSERFLARTIFPAIRQAGFTIIDHPHLCFFRARTDGTVWITDCDHCALETIDERIGPLEKKQQVVEQLIGRRCGNITKRNRLVKTIDCRLRE
jgi:hypothetical protein